MLPDGHEAQVLLKSRPLLHVESLRLAYMGLYDQSITMWVDENVIGKLDVLS